MKKIKTNSGNIYDVDYTIEGDADKGQVYSQRVYATCREHAEQIFKAANPSICVIKGIELFDDAISQHYQEGSNVPEFATAENMMWAMLDVLRNADIKESAANEVIDIACSMMKAALKLAYQSKDNHEADNN